VLNPIDVVVTLKLIGAPEAASNQRLAEELGISTSRVHAALRSAEASRLVSVVPQPGRRPHLKRVNRRALRELISFGVPYVFPATPGRVVRGMPTAASAPVLSKYFPRDPEPTVWPDPDGKSRGATIEPLDPCVPIAARRDESLYELLAVVDAMRVGKAREREFALKELDERLR
jgi:hypothetical protein